VDCHIGSATAIAARPLGAAGVVARLAIGFTASTGDAGEHIRGKCARVYGALRM
jgi:hypothetical protein